jgi:hypothetical protein
MSNIPWTAITGHGIVLRSSPTPSHTWEYSIPPLSAEWYGPYSTREAARIAALHSLLQLARVDVSVLQQPVFSLLINHQPNNPQEYFEELRRQFAELHQMRAALGVEYAYYVDPLIAQARQHLDRLHSTLPDQQQ